MAKQKLHVYAVVEYKGEECRIVKACGSKSIADNIKKSHARKTGLIRLMQKKKTKSTTYHVLKFSVAGTAAYSIGNIVVTKVYEG